MNADEIRATVDGRWSDGSDVSIVQVLAEIAAQLAEANELRQLQIKATSALAESVGLLSHPGSPIIRELTLIAGGIRQLSPEANLPDACREHTCTYYKHYLAYGPADLTHEGFHAAEEKGTEHFQNCKYDGPDICKTCQRHEERLRA